MFLATWVLPIPLLQKKFYYPWSLLILLDMTIINFILWFDVHFTILLFNVVATIGFGFIFKSGFKIPSRHSGILNGLCILIFHGFVPLIPFAELSLIKKILMPSSVRDRFHFGSGNVFVMGYPPIPWLGIMLVGFATGPLFESNMKARKRSWLNWVWYPSYCSFWSGQWMDMETLYRGAIKRCFLFTAFIL